MNSAFAQLIGSRIKAAVGSAAAVSGLDHAVLRGSLREAFARDLLRPVLPARLGLAHGLIASAYDQQSTEQDVIIFDGEALPAVLLDGVSGLVPVDAALYSIEVKSCVNNTRLREAHYNAARLRTILHLPNPKGDAPEGVIPCLFAWGSDLTSHWSNELDRYKKLVSDQADPPLRAICIVGRGYWYFASQWYTIEADAEFSEVKAFVASIFDTYERVASTRVRVGLGQYLRK